MVTRNVATQTREAVVLLFCGTVRPHPDHVIPEHMTYRSNGSENRAEQPGWQGTKLKGV